MFIFKKVGHSKFVEMHGDTSDYFRSASNSDRYFFFINCELKSLSKYLMNNIEFNKHDVDIFINGTWHKYAGNIGRLFKITRLLELRF
jgi:hypothetical protein